MDPSTNVDEIWTALGRFGRFQVCQLLLCWVTILSACFQLLNVVFIGYRPTYQCAPVENVSSLTTLAPEGADVFVTYDKCSVNLYLNRTNDSVLLQDMECPNGYTYSTPKDATFVTELDLVCGRTALAELTQTMTMVGQGVGAVMGSSLADRFGRKTIHLVCHVTLYLVGFGVAWAPNYTVLILLRFLTGALQQGTAMAGAVLALEWVPTNSRYWVEIIGQLFWSTGVCAIAMFGYLLQNYSWRYLQMAFTLYSSFCLVQYWIQEESVRWLLMNGRVKDAERIVRKAARWNKVSYEEVIARASSKTAETKSLLTGESQLVSETGPRVNSDNQKAEQLELNGAFMNKANNVQKDDDFAVERYNILTVMKSKRLCVNSMIIWFAWVTINLTYYALTLTSTSLAGNMYLNFFLNGLMEYIACFVEMIMLQRMGRRPVVLTLHLVTGVVLAAATLLSHFSDGNVAMTTASVVFSLTGKMAITAAFSGVFLYTPELYPTNLRSVGIGFASAIARVGGMLAPFAGLFAIYVPWAPGTIFAVLCFVVSLIILYLPETRGVELPTDLAALNSWYKENSGTDRKQKKKTKTSK
ncbi:organic cation transporter protein-like [Crassostrea virginica]